MFFGVLFSAPANATETLLAVAANFAKPMKQLIVKFEAQSPHKVNMTIGSSGKIYAQIINGAPFDAFFSADQEKPLKLVNEGLALKRSLYTYAIGRLVIWSPDQQKRQAEAAEGVLAKIAIANPKTAPYGAAALEAFLGIGLLPEHKDQLVYGENIAQTYQFIASGVAEFGMVALSQVIDQAKASYEIVPDDIYKPIKQDMVMLNHGQANPASVDFLNFMRSEKVADMIKNFGYK
ncbi:MAG: molybdate ABC transporter substrate-binding protein [Alphaproteobacteria bacterium]|nr:molybdate ABC transporter substrate-binding protein [Alphaproteobacteria bacterium]